MASISDLKKTSSKQGVPQAIVEKDIALSAALFYLSKSKLASHVIFKGGTAIKKAYFADARYSEDLDFTVLKIEKKELLPLLKQAIESKNLGGITFEKVVEEQTSAGLKATVKFKGPLNFAQRIRLDFSFRDNLVGKPVLKEMIDIYGFGNAQMPVLDLDEIMAEKLHALCSRSAPRDMYDIWFLMKRNVKLDFQIVDRKFEFYNEKFSMERAFENIQKMEAGWAQDLKPLMNQLPDAKEIRNYLKEKLKTNFQRKLSEIE